MIDSWSYLIIKPKNQPSFSLVGQTWQSLQIASTYLYVVGINLVFRQNIERAVVQPSLKDAAARVVPERFNLDQNHNRQILNHEGCSSEMVFWCNKTPTLMTNGIKNAATYAGSFSGLSDPNSEKDPPSSKNRFFGVKCMLWLTVSSPLSSPQIST